MAPHVRIELALGHLVAERCPEGQDRKDSDSKNVTTISTHDAPPPDARSVASHDGGCRVVPSSSSGACQSASAGASRYPEPRTVWMCRGRLGSSPIARRSATT